MIEPTPEDIKNGWTRESLASYVREREAAAAPSEANSLVPGNIVTEYVRPKQPPRLEGAMSFNPHKW